MTGSTSAGSAPGSPSSERRRTMGIVLLIFVVLGSASIVLLELSHRRIVATLHRTVSAVDNLTQVRLQVMEAHLASLGVDVGDPTFDATSSPTELDRALDLLDDWQRGRSSLLGMPAEPLQDPVLIALTARYIHTVREVRDELSAGMEADPVRRRLAYDRLGDRAAAVERELHSTLRARLESEERRHRFRLSAWTGVLLAIGLTLGLVSRGRYREQDARVEAELAQERAERRYASLAALAAAGIVRADRDGVVREATRWWEERVGPVGTDGGAPWWSKLPDAERERVQDLWRERAPGRRPFSIEMRHIDREGREGWLLGRWAPVPPDAASHGGEWIGTFVDDSERRSFEEQLHQSQKLEAVGRLTGGVAHDFNNLLTVILGNVDVLRGEDDVDPERRGAVADIDRAARAGRDLVRGLLGFSRRSPLSRETLDLVEAIGEGVRLARRLLPAGVQLDYRPAPPGLRVHADRNALQQILLNLVSNARDAMSGEGHLVVAVERVAFTRGQRELPADIEAGSYGLLTVADDGTGMDRETRERIFEPFFTTKAEGRGTGLGLASVHGLVRQHGGGIEVESEPGRGTTFHVYFPEDSGPATSDPPRARPAWGPSADAPVVAGGETPPIVAGGETPPISILLVDDEDAVRRTMARVLERLGNRVTSAADGSEALEILDGGFGADLVITDISMPEMGGVELHGTLRERGDETPFLFTSGFSDEDPKMQSTIPPDSYFLPKPWTIGELSELLRRISAPDGGDR